MKDKVKEERAYWMKMRNENVPRSLSVGLPLSIDSNNVHTILLDNNWK
jgi:hypothetical protein